MSTGESQPNVVDLKDQEVLIMCARVRDFPASSVSVETEKRGCSRCPSLIYVSRSTREVAEKNPKAELVCLVCCRTMKNKPTQMMLAAEQMQELKERAKSKQARN